MGDVDPVCGMQVQVARAPASARSGGTAYHFCSDHCRQRFSANPPRRILDERLARGEINTAEYQRLSDLIAHGGQAPSGSGSGR